jgi:hypothetical protein
MPNDIKYIEIYNSIRFSTQHANFRTFSLTIRNIYVKWRSTVILNGLACIRQNKKRNPANDLRGVNDDKNYSVGDKPLFFYTHSIDDKLRCILYAIFCKVYDLYKKVSQNKPLTTSNDVVDKNLTFFSYRRQNA